jgi:hypothetical protein
LTAELEWFLAALWQYWFIPTGENMIPQAFELTPEQLTEVGKFWGPIYMSKLSVEERLAGLSSEDLLGHFKPEERLIGLKPEERVNGLSLEERLKGLSVEEMKAAEAYFQQVQRTDSTSNPHSPPK